MKKILLTLALLLGIALTAAAVPAMPGKFKYVQPDGTVIVLERHGDEFYHWTTNEAGQIVEKDENGYYRPSPTGQAQHRYRLSRAQAQRRAKWSSYDNPPVTNFGDRKVLCIIANFSDSTFVIPNPREAFSNMLNQSGYSYNGAIGSVRDYYMDNSWNGTVSQYRPEFDVYGPVTLTQSSKYYDDNGVRRAIIEAYNLLKDQIAIGDYDTDNDGTVDMILFYYPGHNEAEGAGEESIWPHQSTVGQTIDDKYFGPYFCTSELRGKDGDEMCGIGTTCHEFAHSLGLPDFYDTDYEESGGNNRSTGWFDLMASGNYVDNGRRPPYLSALERNMLGWMPAPTLIDASGDYDLEPVRNNAAYRSLSYTEGEYFIYEVRDGYKWDSGLIFNDVLCKGMIYYRVDKSERIVGTSGRSAAYLWENTNKINAYGGHPCYRVEVPVRPAYNWDDLYMPGKNNITSLVPKDWRGEAGIVSLSGISWDGSKVSFHATVRPSFSSLGVGQIRVMNNELSATPRSDKTVTSVEWFLDGVSEGTTPSPTTGLSDGHHTYKVVYHYEDGSSERIYYDVTI